MSLSTLRRRIKSDRVKFIFRYGKYFLQDASLEGRTSISSPHTHKPSVLKPKATEGLVSQLASPAPKVEAAVPLSDLSAYSFFVEEEQTTAAESKPMKANMTSQKLLTPQVDLELFRIKTDYELIIQKQKTQIIKLQSELADLKTLVMALEK